MQSIRTFSRKAVLAAAVIALSACKQNEQAAAAAPTTPIEVGVFTVQPQDVHISTELPGRTASFAAAEVRPQVTGILLKRLFTEGSEVKTGQVLYTIDPAPYRATLAKAQASLESAKSLAQRYERLIQTRSISQQEYDDAKSQYLQAKAAVEAASIDLGYTQIKAPISGVIGRSSVTQGALLTANQPEAIATIQQLHPIYVDIVQPSTAILNLREELASGALKRVGRDQAEVGLLLENGKRYDQTGKLQFSEVSVDKSTGSVTLRAVFPNPDHLLLPGMFVNAELQQGMRSNALLVPQRGVTRDTQGQAVALVVNAQETVELRKVEVVRRVDTDWLVGAGLQPGDRVVVDGVQKVQPGAAVKAVALTNAVASSKD